MKCLQTDGYTDHKEQVISKAQWSLKQINEIVNVQYETSHFSGETKTIYCTKCDASIHTQY